MHMEAGRELYWNISINGLVLYPLAAITVAFLTYVIVVSVRRWRVGRPAGRGSQWDGASGPLLLPS